MTLKDIATLILFLILVIDGASQQNRIEKLEKQIDHLKFANNNFPNRWSEQMLYYRICQDVPGSCSDNETAKRKGLIK